MNTLNRLVLYCCIVFLYFFNSLPIQAKSKINEFCARSKKLEYSIYKSYFDSQIPYAHEITNALINQFEAANAQVVLLANVGLNVSDKKFSNPELFYDDHSHKYMHSGLAFKDPNDGHWRIYHLLNVYGECRNETPNSYVANDKLSTFFAHPHYKMDILMSIPSIELQTKILKIISSKNSLHNPNYSAIANPNSLKKQNSNQFILNILATAQNDSIECQEAFNNNKYKIHYSQNPDLLKAQLCYKAKKFEPSIIRTKLFEPMGITIANEFNLFPKISIDDHSYQSQISHQFPFVSAASLFNYLKMTDPKSSEPKEVCPISIGCNQTKDQILEISITKSLKETSQNQQTQIQ